MRKVAFKTVSLMKRIEGDTRIPHNARRYLLSVMEKILLATEGCFSLLPPMRELRAACLHARSFTNEVVPALEDALEMAKGEVRRLIVQEKATEIRKLLTRGLHAASRMRNPPALSKANRSSLPNSMQSKSILGSPPSVSSSHRER